MLITPINNYNIVSISFSFEIYIHKDLPLDPPDKDNHSLFLVLALQLSHMREYVLHFSRRIVREDLKLRGQKKQLVRYSKLLAFINN